MLVLLWVYLFNGMNCIYFKTLFKISKLPSAGLPSFYYHNLDEALYLTTTEHLFLYVDFVGDFISKIFNTNTKLIQAGTQVLM